MILILGSVINDSVTSDVEEVGSYPADTVGVLGIPADNDGTGSSPADVD